MAFHIAVVFIGLIAGLLALFLLYAEATRYRPEEFTCLHVNENPDILPDGAVFTIITWNLGYAGLGDDMDFFFDGGIQVRTSHQRSLTNLEAISSFIGSKRDVQFFMFQEADKKSRRSYGLHIPDSLKKVLTEYNHSFALNYKVQFVPVPLYNPMGKVMSGSITASKPRPSIAKRIGFPGNYPWPERLFNLQRCMLLSRHPLENGKELVLINTHNSAFDDGGLRRQQMESMRQIMLAEYEKGNYVIAGGDFNQCPPSFVPAFEDNLFDKADLMYVPDDFLPDWHFVYDPSVPTSRRLLEPYDAGSTKTTLIDYFIASPNVHPIHVEGIHLGFLHTDHNPVKATFQLH